MILIHTLPQVAFHCGLESKRNSLPTIWYQELWPCIPFCDPRLLLSYRRWNKYHELLELGCLVDT